MALYKTLTVSNTTKVFIWKIEETITELKQGISLTKSNEARRPAPVAPLNHQA